MRAHYFCVGLAGLILAAGIPPIAGAQAAKAKIAPSSNQAQIDRGRYIVEGVAMCENCHTPRTESGAPDRGQWLMGGPVQMRPAYPVADPPEREPRLAGRPPGTDEDLIKLLTTGIARTGRPPRPPMPPFRMTREDAEAVLAYLKSL